MRLGPPWWPVTAREPAAAVADDEGFVLGVAGDASAAGEVQGFAGAAQQDGGDVRVARDSAGGFDGDRFAGVEQGSAPGALGELIHVDGHEDLGSFASAGDGARVVGIG